MNLRDELLPDQPDGLGECPSVGADGDRQGAVDVALDDTVTGAMFHLDVDGGHPTHAVKITQAIELTAPVSLKPVSAILAANHASRSGPSCISAPSL